LKSRLSTDTTNGLLFSGRIETVATVIDSLIVKLGLDPAGFKKGRKDADESLHQARDSSEKTRKAWESDAKKATAAFRSFRNEIIAIGTAYLGLSAIKSFTSNLVTTGAAVSFLSRNLGMAAGELSLWENAANKMGATAPDVDAAFRNVVKMGEELRNLGRTAGIEGDAPLVRMGLDMQRFAAATTTPVERMMMLSEALSKLSPADAQLWGQMAGFTENMITMLQRGPQAIRAQIQEQKGLFFISDQQAKALQKLQADWNRFVDGFREAGEKMVLALLPTLDRLGREFQNWLIQGKGIDKIVAGIKAFATWLDNVDWHKVGEGLTAIVEAAKAISTALGGVMKAVETFAGGAIGARIGSLFGPLGTVIGGLIGAAAPHVPDALRSLREKFRETDTFKTLSARKGYAGSELAALMGEGSPASANPPLVPSIAAASAQPGAGAGASTVNNFNAPIIVNTQATDAAGVARGLKTEITKQFSTTTQANGGAR
jgi:hypothetical protein